MLPNLLSVHWIGSHLVTDTKMHFPWLELCGDKESDMSTAKIETFPTGASLWRSQTTKETSILRGVRHLADGEPRRVELEGKKGLRALFRGSGCPAYTPWSKLMSIIPRLGDHRPLERGLDRHTPACRL
jgi:hypothetical protein